MRTLIVLVSAVAIHGFLTSPISSTISTANRLVSRTSSTWVAPISTNRRLTVPFPATSDDISSQDSNGDGAADLAYAVWCEMFGKSSTPEKFNNFKRNFAIVALDDALEVSEFGDLSEDDATGMGVSGVRAAAGARTVSDGDDGSPGSSIKNLMDEAVVAARGQMEASQALGDAMKEISVEEQRLASQLGLNSVQELEEFIDQQQDVSLSDDPAAVVIEDVLGDADADYKDDVAKKSFRGGGVTVAAVEEEESVSELDTESVEAESVEAESLRAWRVDEMLTEILERQGYTDTLATDTSAIDSSATDASSIDTAPDASSIDTASTDTASTDPASTDTTSTDTTSTANVPDDFLGTVKYLFGKVNSKIDLENKAKSLKSKDLMEVVEKVISTAAEKANEIDVEGILSEIELRRIGAEESLIATRRKENSELNKLRLEAERSGGSAEETYRAELARITASRESADRELKEKYAAAVEKRREEAAAAQEVRLKELALVEERLAEEREARKEIEAKNLEDMQKVEQERLALKKKNEQAIKDARAQLEKEKTARQKAQDAAAAKARAEMEKELLGIARSDMELLNAQAAADEARREANFRAIQKANLVSKPLLTKSGGKAKQKKSAGAGNVAAVSESGVLSAVFGVKKLFTTTEPTKNSNKKPVAKASTAKPLAKPTPKPAPKAVTRLAPKLAPKLVSKPSLRVKPPSSPPPSVPAKPSIPFQFKLPSPKSATVKKQEKKSITAKSTKLLSTKKVIPKPSPAQKRTSTKKATIEAPSAPLFNFKWPELNAGGTKKAAAAPAKKSPFSFKKPSPPSAKARTVKTPLPKTVSVTKKSTFGFKLPSPPTVAAKSSGPKSTKPKVPPKGVPALTRWKQNRDGSVTGRITGSKLYDENDLITTSPLTTKGKKGELVKTTSGSKYWLN